MQMIPVAVAFEDDRGQITDLLASESINAVTLVTIKRGAVRGNHFHEHTVQWNYVLSGVVEVRTALPGQEPVVTRLTAGALMRVDERESHAFRGIEDAEMMVFTRGPRGGKEYESDTYRLPTPLLT